MGSQWAALLLAAITASSPPLAAAEAAFAQGEYQRVLPLLDESLRSSLTAQERERALELKAITLAAFDQSPQAISAFRELLRHAPAHRLSPAVSPKVVGLFQEAQRGLPAPPASVAAAPVPSPPEPVWKRWWFWGAAAAVVAGVSVGVAWGVTHPPAPVGNLGTRPLP